MTTMTHQAVTTQVFRVWIKTQPEAIWQAITDPAFNDKYGYGCPSEYDLRPSGAFRVISSAEMKEHGAADVIIDGEVIEADPPRKLVQTWRALFTPETAAEPVTRVTWDIHEEQPGLCILTVTHELDNAPVTALQISGNAENAGGGWPFILSDLKTLLETGRAFQG